MNGEAVSLLPGFYPVHDASTSVSVISERRAQPHVRRISLMSARHRIRLDVTAGRGKKKGAIGRYPPRAGSAPMTPLVTG